MAATSLPREETLNKRCLWNRKTQKIEEGKGENVRRGKVLSAESEWRQMSSRSPPSSLQ
jgi:hypothetical protein